MNDSCYLIIEAIQTKTAHTPTMAGESKNHILSKRFRIIKALLRLPLKKFVLTRSRISFLRRAWEAFGKCCSKALGTTFKNIKINSTNARWIYPLHEKTSRSILYLHGGGHFAGSINTHHSFLTYFSKICEARILVVDYRLAPEFPFPASLYDVLKAYHWLIEEEKDSPIWVAGDSSGGGLVIALLLWLKSHKMHLPRGGICFSPWLDLTPSAEKHRNNQATESILNPASIAECAQMYSGENDPYLPLISPLYGEFKGLPPLLMQVGGDEILLNDTLRMFKILNEENCVATVEIWHQLFHVWPYLAFILPEARHALRNVKEFITTHEG